VLDSTTALDPFAIVTTAAGATLQVNQNIRIGAYENNGTLTGSGTLASAFTLTNSGTLGSVIADDGGPSGVLKRTAGTSVINAANTYTGQTRVQSGTLALGTSGSLAAVSTLVVDPVATFSIGGKSQSFSTAVNNGTVLSAGGTLFVSELLSGTGLIDGSVTVTGVHAPGNSPGIQFIAGNLTYEAGASVAWELIDNTTSSSPAAFDEIWVGAGLAFNAPTALALSFDGLGSLVDWSDTFWSTAQSWTIYYGNGGVTGFSNFSISTLDWLDSTGTALSSSRPDASFSLAQQGSNVVLTYSAVPEPSTLILVGLGAAVAACCRRPRGECRARATPRGPRAPRSRRR
jgi:autotransporter-associated beta strand protein